MRGLIPRKLPDGRNNPEYQIHRRQRRRYWLSRYKEAKGCSECGYNRHGVALDFDHVDWHTKLFNPSSRMLTMSLKNIFAEIRKCRIVCANCHRIHTYESKQFRNRKSGSCGV